MTNERARPQPVRRKARYVGLSILAMPFLLAVPLVSKAAKVPAGFDPYSTTDVGGGLRCVVGDVTNDDAMNGKAYVYLEDAASHKVRWVTRIPLPPNRYQNRATHCVSEASKIYALVQSDTSSAQALSQTFVNVATLDRATGHIESTEKVIAQEAGRTPSTWVEKGAENFRLDNGKIVVTGKYFNLDDPDMRKPFTASPTP